MASIALRQHILKVGDYKSPFAHNFLVLYDDDGNVVQELHGRARNPVTRELEYLGRSSDYLEATTAPMYSQGQPEQTLWQGSYVDASARWQAAMDAQNEINRRKLTYNLAGSDLDGPRDWDTPKPDVVAGNSNSVNRTLLDAMALQAPSMPYLAPGIENPLLRQQQIDEIRQKNGLPIPKGGLF